MRLRTIFVGLAAVPLLILGCADEAEQAAEDSLNIEEGTNSEVVDTEEKTLIHEDIEQFRDPNTGEIVSKEVEQTPVTVKTTKRVEEDFEIKSGPTEKSTEGEVPPNAPKDNEG